MEWLTDPDLPIVLFVIALWGVPLYFIAVLPIRLGIRRGAVPPFERAYLIAVPLLVVATCCLLARGSQHVRGLTGDMGRWDPWVGQPVPPAIQAAFLPGLVCLASGLMLAAYGHWRKLPSTEKSGVVGAASGLAQAVIVFIALGISGAP